MKSFGPSQHYCIEGSNEGSNGSKNHSNGSNTGPPLMRAISRTADLIFSSMGERFFLRCIFPL